MDYSGWHKQFLASLALMALSWWMMQPQHKRQEHRMRAARATQSAAQRLARACGKYAMSEELAGDENAAAAGYATAYRLMTGLHARAARWYAGGGS